MQSTIDQNSYDTNSAEKKHIDGLRKDKYNKWFIAKDKRFISEIELHKQPGPKVFDPNQYHSLSEFKKSGFVPYFIHGNYSQFDLQADPELQLYMKKYHSIGD